MKSHTGRYHSNVDSSIPTFGELSDQDLITEVMSSGTTSETNNDDEATSKETACKRIVTNFEKDTENTNSFIGAASLSPKGK